MFSSTCFCNLNEENRLSVRPLPVWSWHFLPTYAWVYSGDSGFLPPPKAVHLRLIGFSQ